MMITLPLKAGVILVGMVCQSYSEKADWPLQHCLDQNFHASSDNIWEVRHNGQELEAQFPREEQAKEFVEQQPNTDCYNIIRVPTCRWTGPRHGEQE
jgi:hypothetical protein